MMRAWPRILTETLEKVEKLTRMGRGQNQQNGMIHPKYGIGQRDRPSQSSQTKILLERKTVLKAMDSIYVGLIPY